MTCAAWKGLNAHLLELRVGYDFEHPITIEHAVNLTVARQRAAQLLETLEDKEDFELLR